MSKKNKIGVVYSTNPDYQYQYEDDTASVETLPPSQQKLHVRMERSGRGGKTVTVVDNFVNSKPEALRRVAELAGRAPAFVEADLVDAAAVEPIFEGRPNHHPRRLPRPHHHPPPRDGLESIQKLMP